MPVHERAVGIVLPRPDVQGVERRETEAVGRVEEMKRLSHELLAGDEWFLFHVAGENQIVGAGQFHASV